MNGSSAMLRPSAAVASLARATTLLTFCLIVLGGVVRSTGSGLACPDWPLCHGRLLPPLQPQVLLEWFHRLVALGVTLAALGLAFRVWSVPATRGHFGGWVALALGLLVTQVLLGALTVWQLLDFQVVTLHLANALLFLSALIVLTERASEQAARSAELEGAASEGAATADSATAATGNAASATGERRLAVILWLAAGATFAQILLGGLVSTQYAGLACPDFPGCQGRLLPPFEGLAALHMAHRFGAYALTGWILYAAMLARGATDLRVRAGAWSAFSLVVLQIVLGVFNVLLAIPVWLTAAHLATATTLFAVLLVTALRASTGRGRREAGA